MLTRVAKTDYGPVEYTEAGAGQPVLYFHGTGVTGDVMAAIESPLTDTGFRLIVPNRPGYGQTPLAENTSLAGCAGVVAALLDALGVPAAGVMGSSGGAAFAVAFAVRHPDRARALVLLCPQLHRWDHIRWLPVTSRWTLPFLRRPWLRKVLLAVYRFQLPRVSAERFLRTEAGDRYPDVASDPAALSLCRTTLAAMAQGTRHAGFANDFAVFVNEGAIGPGSVLRTPTLVIHDEKDPMAPADHVEWFTSVCPGCEKLPVQVGGHLVWVGPDADVVARACVRFLRAHASGPATGASVSAADRSCHPPTECV